MTNPLNASAPAKFTLPPPFTPEDLWARVIRLLSETRGFVTFETFEDAFALPSSRGKYAKETGNRVYEPGADWYFKTTILLTDTAVSAIPPTAEHHLRSYFELKLPANAFGDWKQGRCLLAGNATQTLLEAGWALEKKKIPDPYFREKMRDHFVLGNSLLSLYHYVNYVGPFGVDDDQTCVTEVVVRGGG